MMTDILTARKDPRGRDSTGVEEEVVVEIAAGAEADSVAVEDKTPSITVKYTSF